MIWYGDHGVPWVKFVVPKNLPRGRARKPLGYYTPSSDCVSFGGDWYGGCQRIDGDIDRFVFLGTWTIWTIYELYMNYIWTIYELYMNYIWTIYELYMNYIWTIYELYMNIHKLPWILGDHRIVAFTGHGHDSNIVEKKTWRWPRFPWISAWSKPRFWTSTSLHQSVAGRKCAEAPNAYSQKI